MFFDSRYSKLWQILSSINSYFLIADYLSLFLCLFFLMTSALLELASVALMSTVISIILGGTNSVYLSFLPFYSLFSLLLLCLFLAPLARGLGLKISLATGDTIYFRISNSLFMKVFSCPIEVTDRLNADKLATVVFNNLSRVPELFFFTVQAICAFSTLIVLTIFIVYSGGVYVIFLLIAMLLIAASSSIFSTHLTRGIAFNISCAYEKLLRVIRHSVFSHRLSILDRNHAQYLFSEFQILLRSKRRSQSTELFSSLLAKLLSEPFFYICILTYCFYANKSSQHIESLGIVIFGTFKLLPQLWTISSLPPFISACIGQLDQALNIVRDLTLTPSHKSNIYSPTPGCYRGQNFTITLDKITYSIPTDSHNIAPLLYPYRDNQFCLTVDHLAVTNSQRILLSAPSGAGKSILLDLITGVRKPTSGSISVMVSSDCLNIAYAYQGQVITGGSLLSFLLRTNDPDHNLTTSLIKLIELSLIHI